MESAAFDDINIKWKTIMNNLNKIKNVYRGTHQPGKPCWRINDAGLG